MNRIALSVYCVWVASGSCAVAAEEDRNLANEAIAVFSAKCSSCHGPNLARPRGRFGYVLDLPRVAANPEMVVPSAPEESELWELVRRDEMPPEDSPTGPLSDADKEIVRAWIAAGAPASPLKKEADSRPASSPPSLLQRLFDWLGPFHLLVLHFPIALFISAAASELKSMILGNHTPTPAVRFCVMIGAIGAFATASLGWIHAANGYGAEAPYLLALHRWIGATAASWAIGTALLSERDQRRGSRSPWFRASLFVGALLMAIEGHLGGMLVHGKNFLTGG